MVVLVYHLSTRRVSVLKIPAGVVEPVPACERQTRSTWRTCSDSGDICRRFGYSLTRSSVSRLQVARPAIHVYPNISGTYVHNLQRTTPTAFLQLVVCTVRAVRLLSFATGLVIILRMGSSYSSIFRPQGGDEDAFTSSAWFVTDDAFNEDA